MRNSLSVALGLLLTVSGCGEADGPVGRWILDPERTPIASSELFGEIRSELVLREDGTFLKEHRDRLGRTAILGTWVLKEREVIMTTVEMNGEPLVPPKEIWGRWDGEDVIEVGGTAPLVYTRKE